MTQLLRSALKAGLSLSGIWLALATSAAAIPGQPVEEAKAWMQAHPTLRATPSERLSIRRNNTPSRRYTFHGSVYGPGGGSGESLLLRRSSGEEIVVRSEKFTLVDIIGGVSVTRLEDALRSLYGAEIFADYRRADTLMVYSPGRPEDRGTARAPRSQLLEGELFAYLIEVIPDLDGTINTGAVTVMLKEEAETLQLAIREREMNRRESMPPSNRPVTDRLLGNQSN